MLVYLLKIIKWGWIVYLGYSGINYAITTEHNWVKYYRRIQWKLYLHIIPLYFLIAGVSYVLYRINSFIFGFSWIGLIGHFLGKDTNPANVITVGLTVPIIGIILCLLLCIQLPMLARREELSFRKNTKNWTEGILKSIAFGLMHTVVGVPFGIAIAISFGGIYYTYLYFKGGVKLSTQAHFQYNLGLLLLAFILVIISTVKLFIY